MLVRIVLLTCLLAIAPARAAVAPASVEPDYAALLAEADAIRTSDPARFLALLERLDARRGEATPVQEEQLDFLDAVRRMVYAGEADAALEEFDRLSREAAEEVLRFRSAAMATTTSLLLKRYPDAMRYVNQLVAGRHAIDARDIRFDGVNTIATAHSFIGKPEVAIGYAEEVLSGKPGPRQACSASSVRMEALVEQGLAQDIAEIDRVIAGCEQAGEPIFALYGVVLKARRMIADGQAAAAEALLAAQMPRVEKTRYGVLKSDYLALLAELRGTRGDRAGALSAATAILDLGASAGPETPIAARKILYEAALARGDTPAALVHYRAYAEADRKWIDEIQARESAYQVVRQETHLKNQQLDLISRENELLQLRQRVQTQTAQNDRLVMLLLVLLLASIGTWAWRTKRMQLSLKRLAETDALTGACNRHHFTEHATQALLQSSRSGEDVALVMFDLDHFKLINDRFGHPVGDWALRHVVGACLQACGGNDLLGRLGGEEFAILLVGAGTRDARRLAEECRLRLAGIDTGPSGHAFRITASFGVSGSALSGYDLARLMSHADKMLYRAKREGRNRVFAYELPEPAVLPVTRALDDEAGHPGQRRASL